MKIITAILFFIFLQADISTLYAQQDWRLPKHEQCATMQRLVTRLDRDPLLKTRFNQQLETFNRVMDRKAARPQTTYGVLDIKDLPVYTIPVVFHIVLTNPSVVTDEQIFAQLDILNKTYSASDPDSSQIPAYFKPLFGKSRIQFCLAQRMPDDENTTGIDRMTTTKTSFFSADDGVKHAATGGVNLWNGDKYLNIWVCALGDNLLGYGTFPDDGRPDEQGVVIDYRSMPGGSFSNYNEGKTLTHEIGHYFNLYHIWGDDNGACTGTDYVDDTPNQSNSSSGCEPGLRTDDCTTGGNGILFQDYMDYSYDPCMLLFTALQVSRMETALLTYRSSLAVSNACTPFIAKALDAQLKAIQFPGQRVCTNNFSPIITIVNRGFNTISSLVVSVAVDNAAPVKYNWSGTLNSLASTTVTLNALTVSQGNHNLEIFVSLPNLAADQNNTNDTLSTTVQYYDPVSVISEGFEGNVFPPLGWDILNPDQSITWKKVTGIAKTGNASVMIDNFDYSNVGQKDYLRLPSFTVANVDSAYLYFQLAAAISSDGSATGSNWDTLEVLISKDCGVSYTSLYQKWGTELVTTPLTNARAFEPTSTEWRRDSVNLTPYINAGPIILAFRNTTEYENNIYLDDINIKTQLINPNLKAAGFLVTPNPASDNITVQFYPNPANLKSVQLFNMLGQKLAEINITSGQGDTAYDFNVSRYAAGMYVIRAVFADRVLTKKFIRK